MCDNNPQIDAHYIIVYTNKNIVNNYEHIYFLM